MRKVISFLLCLIMVFSITIPTFAMDNDVIKVKLCNYVNPEGKWVKEKYIDFDTDPILINDRTMVPIRAIAEELGWKVRWEAFGEDEGKVLLTRNVPSGYDFEKNSQLLAYIYNMRKHIDGKTMSKFGDEVYMMNNRSGEGLGDKYNLDKILYSGDKIYFCTTIQVSKDKPYGPYGNGSNGTVINDFYSHVFNILEDNSYFMASYGTSGDVHPQVVNGRTLVPLRALSEIMGLTVEWNNENRTVIIIA